MIAVFSTIDMVLGLYTWIIIGSAIFSWLYAFNVVNSNNRFVGMISKATLLDQYRKELIVQTDA